MTDADRQIIRVRAETVLHPHSPARMQGKEPQLAADVLALDVALTAAEAEVARLEDAIYECLPIIEHGLSGGSAGDALRYVGRKLSPMVAALAKEDTDE